ncbi:MAG TPA: tetratricopeptide repeat protein [Gemmatimonadaceae bacterium]|nr:tetratricopeptide repeat protein [Gemmatimonadaceae bacterium]
MAKRDKGRRKSEGDQSPLQKLGIEVPKIPEPPDPSESELRHLIRVRKTKRLHDARYNLLDSIDRLRHQGRRAELAQTLKELGELERGLPDRDAPRRHYEESVAIFRELGDPLGLAHTIRHLGDVHYNAGYVALAEPCYNEALSLYRAEKEPPPLDLANAIRSLAVLKTDAGELEDARKLWREAYDLYVNVSVLSGVIECATRLALISRGGGDTERSREWLKRAMSAADASGDEDSARRIREIRSSLDA